MSATITQRRLTSGESHLTFQAMLRTLAEPGTVELLPSLQRAEGVPAAALAVLALADVEVAISVDGDPSHPLAAVLAHTTGATVADAESADLVVATTPDAGLVARCRRGTALAPERGARIVVTVESIEPRRDEDPLDPAGTTITVSGPGVPGERRVEIAGAAPGFFAALAEANRAFPAGVDTWLVTDDGRICAFSRSTHLTIEEP